MKDRGRLPSTERRVELCTSCRANTAIRQKTLREIGRAMTEGDLNGALHSLEREWDTERVLETNASCLILLSLAFSALHDRRWKWLAGGVAAFLLQHALFGWCPPLPVIRASGVRTAGEINAQRTALKALRGDFAEINAGTAQEAEKVLRAAEAR